ncbi:MAG: hypothetical protein ABR501_11280 [Pyrinomonadaceae bacterium]
MLAGIYGQRIPSQASLAEFAYSFSPLVEETSRDTVVIDVEGCALRFGSAYELANQIAKHAESKPPGGVGSRVNVALAGNPDAAIHAAKFCKGVTFTAPGEELTCLGHLPLKALQYSLAGVEESPAEEILETLRLWGVRNFKEFAELPVTGVSERLGQEGLKLRELAAGRTDRHLRLRQTPPVFKSSIDLDYPIAQLEPLSFIFSRLLNQICASLNAYALATNAVQVEMKLEKGLSHELKLNLPYPMRDHKVFLKLLLLDTEMHPPPSAIVAISINCEPVKPRVLQTGLFIPLAPEPEKLELTLARLGKLLGPGNIGSPEVLDTHRPDAFKVNRFELKTAKRKKSKQQTGNKEQTANSEQQSATANPLLAFRRFRPPLRAIVQSQEGCPREISAWGKNKSVYGKVVGVAGPWRTSGDWWRVDAWARDEWDVAIESTRSTEPRASTQIAAGHTATRQQMLYRIYRELSSGTWFVEGVYD